MDMHIIKLNGHQYIAVSADAQTAVDFIAKRLGLTQGKADVRTVTFDKTWFIEIPNQPVKIKSDNQIITWEDE